VWAGNPWHYTRVGSGGKSSNAVKIVIRRPTLVICGGLQTELHELLGDERSGLRPRWLPFLAAMPAPTTFAHADVPVDWQCLLGGGLLPARDQERGWHLDEDALSAFTRHRQGWKQ